MPRITEGGEPGRSKSASHPLRLIGIATVAAAALAVAAADDDGLLDMLSRYDQMSVSPTAESPIKDIKRRNAPTIDFPSVGLILRASEIDPTVHRPHCTGTLIAPDKVLTAAHCICDDGDAWILTHKECTQDGDAYFLRPDSYRVYFQHAGLKRLSTAGSIRIAQHWNGVDDLSVRGDLAVLTLAEPVTTIEPANAVPNTHVLPMAADRANSVAVGFGKNLLAAFSATFESGIKFHALAQVRSCEPSSALCYTWGTAQGASLSGIICQGDSGGPLFGYDATTSKVQGLLGVASKVLNVTTQRVDQGHCIGGDTSFHIDLRAKENRQFLDRFAAPQSVGEAWKPEFNPDDRFLGDYLGMAYGLLKGGSDRISFEVSAGSRSVSVSVNGEGPSDASSKPLEILLISPSQKRSTQSEPFAAFLPGLPAETGTWTLEVRSDAGRRYQAVAFVE